MKVLFLILSIICVCIVSAEGLKLKCTPKQIRIGCNCFVKKSLKARLTRKIDGMARRIIKLRLLRRKQSMALSRLVRRFGGKMAILYRCQRRRRYAMRTIVRTGRRLRVIRATRRRCWRWKRVLWRMKKALRRNRQIRLRIKRRLRYSARYRKRLMRRYRRALLYKETKVCRFEAYKLGLSVRVHTRRAVSRFGFLRLLKRKARRYGRLVKRWSFQANRICRLSKALKARSRILRKRLILTRKSLRSSSRCVRLLHRKYRAVFKRRLSYKLMLSRVKRILSNLYRKRIKKIGMLCKKVDPSNRRCKRLSIKIKVKGQSKRSKKNQG